MYKFPSAKGFRRRTRLENAATSLERMNGLVMGVVNILGVYSDPNNWQPTDETKDVKNEAGIVVGVERIHTWSGPGSGPELAANVLKQIFSKPGKQVNLTRQVQ